MTVKRLFEFAILFALSVFLSACAGTPAVSTSATTSETTTFGISLESSPESAGWSEQYSGVRLDVVVPLFDPNIPENSDDYEKLGIWPELRRTEAIRFAVSLRDEIEKTDAFESVRATPDTAVSADLFVSGKIIKSNGEDVEISVQVHDISGARWLKKNYKHRVKEYHWQSVRSSGKDPYQPVFMKVAKDIVDLLKKKKAEDLTKLRAISDLQFASAFAPEAFAHHLEVKDKRVTLASLPAVDDPMVVRTRAVRVMDGLFMDKMQTHYTDFVGKTNQSYIAWQEHSLSAAKAERQAKKQATKRALGGILLLLGAAAAANNSDLSDSLTSTAVAAAAVGGIVMMQKSFASNAEGRFHRDNLLELGSTLNFDVAPQVVQLEETTYTFQGDVKSQYRQWQAFLKDVYERESTPAVQL